MGDKTQTLKVACIIDETCFYNWQKTIVDFVMNSSEIDLVLCITTQGIKPQKKKPFLWNYFLKLDNKFFNPKPYALSNYKLDSVIKDTPVINYTEEHNDELSNPVDVVINFSDVTPHKSLIKASKYGVWFLTQCDINEIGKRPYGIWEMLFKKPESVAILRYINNEMDHPATIGTTSSCTDLLSYKRNINSLLWQAHLLVINNLKLLASDKVLFINKLEAHKDVFTNKDIVIPIEYPSNSKMLGYTLSLYLKKLKQLIESKFYFNQWALLFLNSNGHKDPFLLKDYTKILPPKDRFWADPFLIKEHGKTYLFIEELIYKNKLGHLSVMEIDSDGNYTQPIKILEKNYHLSYPFIFKDNGDYYMIPETSGHKDIQLYKAENFPLDWKLQETLMEDVVAVDTTIHKDGDTYWMFTSQRNHEGVSKHVELYLYSSKDLKSNNWKPHPLNPIVSDVNTARPAGSIYTKNNKLYRVSQNCSKYYGYGLNIIEITRLTENHYEERLEQQILPNWEKRVNSTHTFNYVDDLYISDIKIKRNRFF